MTDTKNTAKWLLIFIGVAALVIGAVVKKSAGAKRSAGVPGYNFYSRSEEHVFRNR